MSTSAESAALDSFSALILLSWSSFTTFWCSCSCRLRLRRRAWAWRFLSFSFSFPMPKPAGARRSPPEPVVGAAPWDSAKSVTSVIAFRGAVAPEWVIAGPPVIVVPWAAVLASRERTPRGETAVRHCAAS